MRTFNAESYAAAWRKRNKNEQERTEQRIRAALIEAKRLARLLAADAAVAETILFGSLAEETVRNENFDIDLAIRGGNWLKAQEIAEDSPFKVDVVEYDAVPEHIRKRIDERGLVLWPTE